MLGAPCSSCCGPACETPSPEFIQVTLTGGSQTPAYYTAGGKNFFYVATRNVLVSHDFAGTYSLTKIATRDPIEGCGGYHLDVYVYQDEQVALTFGLYPSGGHPCLGANWWLGVNFLRWWIVEDWRFDGYWQNETIPSAVSLEDMLSGAYKSSRPKGLQDIIQVNHFPYNYLGSGGAWGSNDITTNIAPFLESSNIVLKGYGANFGWQDIDTSYVENGYTNTDIFYRHLFVGQMCPGYDNAYDGVHYSKLNTDGPFSSSSVSFAGDYSYTDTLYGRIFDASTKRPGAELRQSIAYSVSFDFPQSFETPYPTSPAPRMTVSGEIAVDRIEMFFHEDSQLSPRVLPYG